VGLDKTLFDDTTNETILRRVAMNCYLPTNEILLSTIRKNPSVKVTFSISGTALEQFERYAPEVLTSFRQLAATGNVEFLGETYFHSLSCLVKGKEFSDQVKMHRQKLFQILN
jgi:alpha-amylase